MDQTRARLRPDLNVHDAYALAGLLGLAALLLWRYLFTSPAPLIYPESALGTDLPREVWPLWRFLVDTLRETGQIALWRPYLLSGAPVIGHTVAPILYLPNWLALLLPLPLALNLTALLHLWWAGVGTYVVLRWHHGTRREAAFIGALLFGLSPKWIAHLSGGHWPMMAAVAWWPWTWLGFVRYWATHHKRWFALTGFGLAMQALNMGQIFAMSLLWMAACTFGYLQRGALLRWFRDAAIGWGMVVVLILGLAAGQLWPMLELLPYSNRIALTQAEAASFDLPPLALLTAIFPPELKFPEWFLYPGAGALLLALLSWTRGWARHERWWAIGAVVGLLLSLGNNTPLYSLLYRIVPGFSLFRVSPRWWLFTLFALALLAAWGAEKWLDKPPGRDRREKTALAVLVLLYLLAGALKLSVAKDLPFEVLPAALALLLASGVVVLAPTRWTFAALLVVLFADVGSTTAGLIQPVPEATIAASDEVVALLEPAAARGERSFAPYVGVPEPAVVAFDLLAVDGYDPFHSSAYAGLARLASGCDFEAYVVAVPPTRSSPDAVRACPTFEPDMDLLALLNVRYVILPSPADVPGATLALTDADGERHVYDLGEGTGLGRAFGVVEGTVASQGACLDRLAPVDPSVQAIVEESLPFRSGSEPPRVLSVKSQVNGEEFTVEAEDPGLLVRSESWAPGWRARVDGEAAEVLRVDCALQGVWLEPGQHHVRFEYAPTGYRVGRWISLATVLGLLGWGGWLIFSSTKRA